MLKYLGERELATRIQSALEQVLGEGRVQTTDLGGRATTSEFTNAVISLLG
jgi:isocitrate/isopropylmalate dehydrogenase